MVFQRSEWFSRLPTEWLRTWSALPLFMRWQEFVPFQWRVARRRNEENDPIERGHQKERDQEQFQSEGNENHGNRQKNRTKNGIPAKGNEDVGEGNIWRTRPLMKPPAPLHLSWCGRLCAHAVNIRVSRSRLCSGPRLEGGHRPNCFSFFASCCRQDRRLRP